MHAARLRGRMQPRWPLSGLSKPERAPKAVSVCGMVASWARSVEYLNMYGAAAKSPDRGYQAPFLAADHLARPLSAQTAASEQQTAAQVALSLATSGAHRRAQYMAEIGRCSSGQQHRSQLICTADKARNAA